MLNDKGERINADLNAFVHIRDRNGNTLAQHDSQPRNGAYPHLDITFLGMGPDGHIASLFPERAGIRETERTVIPVVISPFINFCSAALAAPQQLDASRCPCRRRSSR